MTRSYSFKAAGIGLGLVLLTLLAYLPALQAGYIWDDPDYVLNNPNLRTLAGLIDTWLSPRSLPQYYPMVHSTYWLEYQLWQLDPLGYHLVNILLHGLASFLLWRVLLRLEIPGALLAAALFAIHPVHVESVAWITERKNVLAGVFYLAALLVYLPILLNDADLRRHWRRYLAALLLFALALLSKSVTCSLPAAILLLAWYQHRNLRRQTLAMLPFFVLGLAMALVTAMLERSHVGAAGPEWDLSLAQRVLIAGGALWFYAAKLLLPVNLSFIYPRWNIDAQLWWQWMFPIAAVTLLIVLWALRHRVGRGPLVAALFFGGTLLPALGFFNVYPMRYSFVADHFQYHASIGLLVLAAAILARCAAELPRNWQRLAAVTVLAPLMILTGLRTLVYKDALTLWTDTLARNPNSWMAHTNLGHALVAAGRPDDAADEYLRALELAPHVADTHRDAAIVHAQRGDLDLAIQHYRRALQIEPRMAGAWFGLGSAYNELGRIGDARTAYQRAIELWPQYALAHYNFALLLESAGDLEKAVEHYRLAAAYRPGYADAHYNRAIVLEKLNRPMEAQAEYRRAIAFRPDFAEAMFRLGLLLARAGNPEAVGLFDQALRLKPELARQVETQLNHR